MPLLETKGAGSAQGFGLSLGGEKAVYIEDVFSTYLYTGNSSTQTITNGIDLAGEGGLVWMKARGANGQSHNLYDTVRGVGNALFANSTTATVNFPTGLTSFNSTGFSLGSQSQTNFNADNFASWTFRKQPKFFDVVTYTGDGSASKSIAHNLGSVPGCIIVKATSTTGAWAVWHRSGTQNNQYAAFLEQTGAYGDTGANVWGTGGPSVTSSSFTVGTNGTVNASGVTYVAYLFAHDAGGFGLEGTDNVISCGSFTTDGSGNASVNLGYEPQWVLIKSSSNAENWYLVDNMRGFPVSGDNKALLPNLLNAEGSFSQPNITNTGFAYIGGNASRTYIYIAIRRGPMKVPTSGTSVFSPVIGVSSSTAPFMAANTSHTVDTVLLLRRGATTDKYLEGDRLLGSGKGLTLNTTAAEFSSSNILIDRQTGVGSSSSINFSDYVFECFKRAPGFFDVVCYTGTGVAGRAVNHNLGVAPEIVIAKIRSGSVGNWRVNLYNVLGSTTGALLESSGAAFNDTSAWASYYPDESIFKVGSLNDLNASGFTYVAYLFASCPGVSKVGSYTGNGSSQTINCGFTGGARLVLIKRTDSTGDWYVWDSSRGIVAGNDPHLSLNTTAAEVTTNDSVDTNSTGFVVNQVAATNVNVNTATYIFLAIA